MKNDFSNGQIITWIVYLSYAILSHFSIMMDILFFSISKLAQQIFTKTNAKFRQYAINIFFVLLLFKNSYKKCWWKQDNFWKLRTLCSLSALNENNRYLRINYKKPNSQISKQQMNTYNVCIWCGIFKPYSCYYGLIKVSSIVVNYFC